MISYTNKAALELTERMGEPKLRGYTFHKLALDIIGQITGKKPSICEKTDSLFINIYHNLLSDKKFKKAIIEYFIDYQIQQEEWEKRKQERRDILSEQKRQQIKTLLPDMDGNSDIAQSLNKSTILVSSSSLDSKL